MDVAIIERVLLRPPDSGSACGRCTITVLHDIEGITAQLTEA
jgi:hypothetical protein